VKRPPTTALLPLDLVKVPVGPVAAKFERDLNMREEHSEHLLLAAQGKAIYDRVLYYDQERMSSHVSFQTSTGKPTTH
jgi:hypothetical protein